MAFKLKTSKRAENIFSRIEASEALSCYVLVKLAIALSLRDSSPLDNDFLTANTLGRELNRQTITGDSDTMYRCLVELHLGHHITDEEFFPYFIKGHIERGALLLEQEQRYSNDFLIHLSELNKSL